LLENVKVPGLSTHHVHRYDEKTGVAVGARSDLRPPAGAVRTHGRRVVLGPGMRRR